jgi:hypothetical protein
MQASSTDRQADKSELVARYLHLTKTVMPALSRETSRKWPVKNDHCFQRIILDTICGDVWYKHLARPAYQSLSLEQATSAVLLCENIINGHTDLAELNRQSLCLRGK